MISRLLRVNHFQNTTTYERSKKQSKQHRTGG